MSAEFAEKFCFKCRKDTVHVRVGWVGGIAMYQCPENCGAAPREITAREDMTSTPRIPAPPAEAPAGPKAVSKPPRKIKTETIYINRRVSIMPKPIEKTQFVLTVERIVDEKLSGSGAATLTREDVLEIVRGEFAAQLGVEVKAPKARKGGKPTADGESATSCPRGEHKYACPSKKCIEAGYKVAA